MLDGNEAAARVAYRASEVVALYPITPASPMGEHVDAWAAEGQPNLWGTVPEVVELQSEGGAIGAVHGALQVGSLTTTFTSSQGLLLMLPNLYKIAGELTPCCLHVAARSLATHALSIFCDHSDVMAARQTGFALLCSSSSQEAHDMALVGLAASLRARVPFMHFFDGFRTSHEISPVELLSDDDMRALLDEELITAFRARALTPERPVVRGTSQNPDAFFQGREAQNRFYDECPDVVTRVLDALHARTGRRYRLFEYHGHPAAERVVVVMGSAAETARETVEALVARGERVGVVKVRLYRPFSSAALIAALPPSTKAVAVLDRTKEPGALGEPLFLDVLAALAQRPSAPRIVGGRYGLGSKELTPACVKAVLDELARDEPRHGFTLGIDDDVTHRSLPTDDGFDVEHDDVVRAVFYGLGSDGTVSANKSSIKIIGEATRLFAQGYFVYDSKKSGAATVSHLRFGPRPIRSAYLIKRARFVACHRLDLLYRFDILESLEPGGILLLNAPGGAAAAWSLLPDEVRRAIEEKGAELFAIDAERIADEVGLKGRINTVMQACFFALTRVLDEKEALRLVKEGIEDSYGKKASRAVLERNFAAVDRAREGLARVAIPGESAASLHVMRPVVPEEAPPFVQRVTAALLSGRGDSLPVSAFPVDGTWPVGTTQWERRELARELPAWVPELCIQCNQCSLICPHAALRIKAIEPGLLDDEAGALLPTLPFKAKELTGARYSLQVAPDDCTGCQLCVEMCPAKDKKDPSKKALGMVAKDAVLDDERKRWSLFSGLPSAPGSRKGAIDAKSSQWREPLFEFSGACTGCGETPYIKLLTQLYGERAVIANATGCSSIYGGNLPTTPYTTTKEGHGPAWINSLFEDNAELGYGFRVALDAQERQAKELLARFTPEVGDELARSILEARLDDGAALDEQRARVRRLKQALERVDDQGARRLADLADVFVAKSVWLVGGDGWAYDIDYGGLDHVLAAGRDINVLVLDTEVYSNTGGQQSKATPIGASAKFAQSGKELPKKDLGLIAMSYGRIYVAQIAMAAKVGQAVRAFVEAASYPGPSLVIAYSHCIAHGYDLRLGAEQQKRAVSSGVWPLYRFDPRRVKAGLPPLQLDSGEPSTSVEEYMRAEGRFLVVERQDKERFARLVESAEENVQRRLRLYKQLADIVVDPAAKRPVAAE